MAKKRGAGGFRMPGGGGGGGAGDTGGMMQQVQKMQEEMMKTQEELGGEMVRVTVGGGTITVVITGQQHVESIEIDPEVIDPEDVEMLQDLVVAAVNEAIEKSREMAAERMGKVTGGLDIPGLGL
jgi:DNA-binding YbaB/EbfC family protein